MTNVTAPFEVRFRALRLALPCGSEKYHVTSYDHNGYDSDRFGAKQHQCGGWDLIDEATGQVAAPVTGQVAVQVLRYCETPRKASEIQAFLKLKHRQTFRENYLDPRLEEDWLERTSHRAANSSPVWR